MSQTGARILTLIAGVALGALGSGLLFQVLDRPVHSVDAAEPPAPAPMAGATPPPVPSLHEPAANRGSEESSTRSRVAIAGQAEDARTCELLAALNAAYARGEISDDELVGLLFSSLLAHGNAEGALELVTRFRPQDVSMLVQVAGAFSQAGQLDRAREIIERAMALSPDDQWVLDQYANLDANAALPYFLARLNRQPPPGDASLRLEIAQLLANSGRTAEALAHIDALLLANPRDVEALQLLSRVDPAAAERAVREIIASGDPNNDWSAYLLQIVLEHGRAEDAVALLESRRALGVIPEANDYGSIAMLYLEQGKTEYAVKLWTSALEAEQGDPDSWTSSLQQYAPEQLLTLLEARTASGANDEFWGALGDSYWRAGRRSEALNAWREASRLDPEDGEWPTKLTAVAAGLDPL